MLNILIAAILIVAFFMCIGAYCMGVKHGKQLSKATVPTLDLNPVKSYKEHKQAKEQSKEDKIQSQAFDNWLSYDGNPQKPLKEGE